jgi:hypothetical protein
MEDEAMNKATEPTSHLAEIDAWMAKKSLANWETPSKPQERVYIGRSGDGVWLFVGNEDTELADDTTLAELLTVCRVLGIPLEVEGPSE